MAWNGSGTPVRLYNFQSDRDSSIKILAAKQDDEWDNVINMLANCLTLDGQNALTGNMNAGSQRITNLANGIADTDAVSLQQARDMVEAQNLLDNSSVTIANRGASVTGSGGAFVCDRWHAYRGGQTGYTIAKTTGGMPNKLRLQRDSGNANTTGLQVGQQLGLFQTQVMNAVLARTHSNGEGIAQQYLVASCYVKKGADFSGSGATLEIVSNGTSAAQNINTGANWSVDGTSTVLAASISASTWTRVSCVVSAAALTGALNAGVRLKFNAPSGTAGTNDYIDAFGFQLEFNVSGLATVYQPQRYEDEMFRCKRWYQLFGFDSNSGLKLTGYGAASQVVYTTLAFPVEFARAPSGAPAGTWSVSNCGQPAVDQSIQTSATLKVTVTGLGAYSAATDSSDDGFTFDAEP